MPRIDRTSTPIVLSSPAQDIGLMEISQRVAPLLRKSKLRHSRTLPIPCLDRRRFFRASGGQREVYKKLPITGAAFSSPVGINP
jgi:hypothetical protein